MPRTKRHIKKEKRSVEKESNKENDDQKRLEINIDAIEIKFAAMMMQMERLCQDKLVEIDRAIAIAMMGINPSDTLIDDDPQSSESQFLTTTTDSDLDEAAVMKIPGRVTRSQGPSRRMLPPAIPDRFRTPNCNLAPGGTRYNMITPKVQPNCPISILRRPVEGEIAFALSGSPLLVSSRGGDDVANINIPLAGGKVLSILPQSGLRLKDLPDMEDSMMDQLLKLRDNIDYMLAGSK